VEALIGHGGMGAVYRAEDLRLGRTVALKLLAEELVGDARFRERFLAESRLAASIDHPGIVPIFEADEADGLLYIAMRYVDGGDLGGLLRREGPLTPDRAVALVTQLAAALDAAHAGGLVHRDVKPSNALVSVDGGTEHVYLADFGLTKHSTLSGPPKTTGQMVGTLDYVAPEQIRGDAIDGRADLYSLGCVLFECMTGETPYPRRSEVATIYAHLEEEPPRASERRPGLPTALDAVLIRALAKDPARRWRSGAELATAASAALSGGASAARTPRRRRARGLMLTAAVALATLATAGGLLVTRSGRDPALAAIDANVVAVIDPAHASLTAQIPVGASPSHMAVGERGVWVTNADDQTVSRLDPATRTVRQTIEVGSAPGAIAAGAGGVWVVNTLDRTLSWISPATNQVVKTIPVGNGPSGVCVGGGAVWVANGDDHTVLRIDPHNGRRTGKVGLDDAPTELACGGGAVWASSESAGTVTEIGAANASVIGTTRVGAGVSAVGFGDGALWVTNPLTGTVSEIDPRRAGVARTVAFGAGDGPAALAVGAGAVWVSNQYAGTVVRIDPRRGVIVRTLKVGNRPQGLALVGGALWTGVRAGGARHRGGTLRTFGGGTNVIFRRAEFDPAVPAAYGLAASRILNITNDGLTAFRHAGGLEGTKLVPDLAVALPDATDGGRTYAFKLRSGVRYSNGALVRPSDIRHGLERALRAGSPGAGFYGSIVGVAACIRKPSGCDLSRGIAVDDRTGTITFHLTAPDSQFLYELALDFAVAVPAGIGPPDSGRDVPATGPYVIASERSPGELRLVRNPHFRVWSSAAKPDGYPDVIVRQSGGALSDAVRAVEQGRAEYVNVGSAVSELPPRELDLLFTRYASQVHTSSESATVYYWLNTHEPPFDHLDVRRALNYAVDRRAALALEGGARFAQPTCQIMPPNFPGYRPYCPYTADAGPGRPWTRPDVARARRLVARSHTRGMHITVWGRSERFKPHSRFLVRLLNQLGYRASLRLVSDKQIGGIAADPQRHPQTGPQIWTADFAAASNFLGLTFSCDALISGDHVGLNWSRFCDRRTRSLMRRAQRLPATEQAAANTLWAAVDREVVDRAAAIPLLNPKAIELISRRTGNAQYSPQWGLLLDQLWVR
jgi:YVTN family beta-propeller protein